MQKIKSQNLFLIIIFALVITIPTLDSIFNFSPVKDLFEKRRPVEKPLPPESLADLKTYPRKFEAFFNDNYGFRKTLIYWYNRITDKIFDESPIARVSIGKDDWLYFDNNDSLLDAEGKAPLGEELIEKGIKSFYRNWQSAKNQGVEYLLVIAADKSTIYPEFLPDYIKPANNHRIDKFLTALKKRYPDFPVLDLRPILLKAKEKEIIYQKTDTHWNRRGSQAAYVEMMKELGKRNIQNANFKPRLRKEFADKADQYISGDIADMMGNGATNLNYDVTPKFKLTAHPVDISEEEKKFFHRPTSYVNSNKNLPRLFTYQDSYFGDLFEFVSQHFSNSFYINEYPCDINLEIIKKYHSNVVIQEFWEGRIEFILQGCKA